MTEAEFAALMAVPGVNLDKPDDFDPSVIGAYGLEPDGEVCGTCDGDGGWSETVEGADGRDVEIGRDCHRCNGTGRIQ